MGIVEASLFSIVLVTAHVSMITTLSQFDIKFLDSDFEIHEGQGMANRILNDTIRVAHDIRALFDDGSGDTTCKDDTVLSRVLQCRVFL